MRRGLATGADAREQLSGTASDALEDFTKPASFDQAVEAAKTGAAGLMENMLGMLTDRSEAFRKHMAPTEQSEATAQELQLMQQDEDLARRVAETDLGGFLERLVACVACVHGDDKALRAQVLAQTHMVHTMDVRHLRAVSETAAQMREWPTKVFSARSGARFGDDFETQPTRPYGPAYLLERGGDGEMRQMLVDVAHFEEKKKGGLGPPRAVSLETLVAKVRDARTKEDAQEVCELLGDEGTNLSQLMFTAFRLTLSFVNKTRRNAMVSGTRSRGRETYDEALGMLQASLFKNILESPRWMHADDLRFGALEFTRVPPHTLGEAMYSVVVVVGGMLRALYPTLQLDMAVRRDAPKVALFAVGDLGRRLRLNSKKEDPATRELATSTAEKALAVDHAAEDSATLSVGDALRMYAGALQGALDQEQYDLRHTGDFLMDLVQHSDALREDWLERRPPKKLEGGDFQTVAISRDKDADGRSGPLSRAVLETRTMLQTVYREQLNWLIKMREASFALHFHGQEVVPSLRPDADGSSAYLWRVWASLGMAMAMLFRASLARVHQAMHSWNAKAAQAFAAKTAVPCLVDHVRGWLAQREPLRTVDRLEDALLKALSDTAGVAAHVARAPIVWVMRNLPLLNAMVAESNSLAWRDTLDEATSLQKRLEDLRTQHKSSDHHTEEERGILDRLRELVIPVLPVQPRCDTMAMALHNEGDTDPSGYGAALDSNIHVRVMMGNPKLSYHINVPHTLRTMAGEVTLTLNSYSVRLGASLEADRKAGVTRVRMAPPQKLLSQLDGDNHVHLGSDVVQPTRDEDGFVHLDSSPESIRVMSGINALALVCESVVRRWNMGGRGFPASVVFTARRPETLSPTVMRDVFWTVFMSRGYQPRASDAEAGEYDSAWHHNVYERFITDRGYTLDPAPAPNGESVLRMVYLNSASRAAEFMHDNLPRKRAPLERFVGAHNPIVQRGDGGLIMVEPDQDVYKIGMTVARRNAPVGAQVVTIRMNDEDVSCIAFATVIALSGERERQPDFYVHAEVFQQGGSVRDPLFELRLQSDPRSHGDRLDGDMHITSKLHPADGDGEPDFERSNSALARRIVRALRQLVEYMRRVLGVQRSVRIVLGDDSSWALYQLMPFLGDNFAWRGGTAGGGVRAWLQRSLREDDSGVAKRDESICGTLVHITAAHPEMHPDEMHDIAQDVRKAGAPEVAGGGSPGNGQ